MGRRAETELRSSREKSLHILRQRISAENHQLQILTQNLLDYGLHMKDVNLTIAPMYVGFDEFNELIER